MPFNGAGVFTRLYSWVADAAANRPITPSKFDADGNDVAAALSDCITRDGQGGPTADIPWNNHKLTLLANPVNPEDAVNLVTAQGFAPDGQCQFQAVNGTTCTLVPVNGGALWINGAQQIVPAAGVTLSSTGSVSGGGNIVAGTKYYVYAYMNSSTPSVMALEASTTGWTLDSAGRKNKTGDTTRRLVGMVYTATGSPGVFNLSSTLIGVLSYFNRRNLNFNLSVSNSTSSSTPVSLTASAAILTWGDEALALNADGYVAQTTSVGGGFQGSEIYVDGSSFSTSSVANWSSGFTNVPFACGHAAALSEGAHSVALYGSASSGNGTWNGEVSGIVRG